MKFRKKSIIVSAEIIQMPTHVRSGDTVYRGEVGDYLVTEGEEKYFVKPEIFKKTYELIEEQDDSLGHKQKLFCQVCGKEFLHNFINGFYDGRVCSKDCWEELDWRRVLSIMGKKYYKK